MKKSLFLAAAAVAACLLAGKANAVLVAYEGFDGVSDGTFAGTAATGTGFADVWDITNGNGGASTTEAAGLSYPSTYAGTNTAIGGNGRVTGASGANAFLALDFDSTADAAVNSSPRVWISVLAKSVGVSTTDNGILDAGTRDAFNLAAEYPRNFGFRLMNQGNGSNSALGTVGNAGNWNGGGQSVYDQGDSNPEVVDTWAAFNFNDANNIFTGNGGNKTDGDPSPNYNGAPHHYLGPDGAPDELTGVDHLVLGINTVTSRYQLWVNPRPDGTSDGTIEWQHTDGAVVPFVMHAFGLEAGNDSSERAVGDMVIDEIRIATDFSDAVGFAGENFNVVPEPSTIALLGLGGVALVATARRRK